MRIQKRTFLLFVTGFEVYLSLKKPSCLLLLPLLLPVACNEDGDLAFQICIIPSLKVTVRDVQ